MTEDKAIGRGSARHRLRIAAEALAGLSESHDGGRGEVLWVDGDEGHHATRVLRMRAGDPVELIDGAGSLALGVVGVAERGRLEVERVQLVVREPEVMAGVTVLAPAPKGSRADVMADQLAQVGVVRWLVVETQRTVVEPGDGKLDKWRRRSQEASKQCGRLWDMAIEGPKQLAELIQSADDFPLMRCFMDLGGPVDANGVSKQANAGGIVIAIGPEGGWTDTERSTFIEAGWQAWTVGRHVMRLETAAVVGAGIAAQALNLRHE